MKLVTIGLLLAAICLTAQSCAIRVNPDGSKDATVDAKTAAKIVTTLSNIQRSNK